MELLVYLVVLIISVVMLLAQARLFSIDRSLKEILAELRAAPRVRADEAPIAAAPASVRAGASFAAGWVVIIVLGIFVAGILGLAWWENQKGAKANEVSALGSMRTISLAVTQYHSTYRIYPARLEQLGSGPTGEISADHADMIDAVLASGSKSGYRFEYRATLDRRGYGVGFQALAVPLKTDTKLRSFFVDQSGVIRQSYGREPSASDPPIL